ncbi:hypothetical protein SDC9_50907 [bioreactor metagenome]|uniref:UbiC transcription regulator-associated domain-containing protein n=1 Tax=bioreactor metagenome TaxID=1076179 RepID=A0A644WMF7_9ZZZZ
MVGLGYPQIIESEAEIVPKGTYRILLKEQVEASPTDKAQFNLSDRPEDSMMWHFKSLHIVDGKPSVLSDFYVAPRFGSSLAMLEETSDQSFFEIVGRRTGQRCHFVNGKVAAINPNEEICKQLGIECKSASLWCRGLCVLDDGTLVGRCTKVFNGLMYEFAVESKSGLHIGSA